MRPVLWVVPLGVGLGVDGAAAVAAGAGGAQPGVAVAGGEHTPHLTICTAGKQSQILLLWNIYLLLLLNIYFVQHFLQPSTDKMIILKLFIYNLFLDFTPMSR